MKNAFLFLISPSFLLGQGELNLPELEIKSIINASISDLNIYLDEKNNLYVEEKKCSVRKLENKIRKELKKRFKKGGIYSCKINFWVDKEITFDKISPILKELDKLGLEKIRFIVKQKGKLSNSNDLDNLGYYQLQIDDRLNQKKGILWEIAGDLKSNRKTKKYYSVPPPPDPAVFSTLNKFIGSKIIFKVEPLDENNFLLNDSTGNMQAISGILKERLAKVTNFRFVFFKPNKSSTIGDWLPLIHLISVEYRKQVQAVFQARYGYPLSELPPGGKRKERLFLQKRHYLNILGYE